VTDYKVGDRVIVNPILICGECAQCRAGRPNICEKRRLIGIHQNGAYAEAVSVPQSQLYRLPEHLTWEQGAFAEPMGISLHAVANTPFTPDDTVLIVGAGPIGLLTLLAARRKGAKRIIMTDRVSARLARAQQLGADVVINVAEEDAIARIKDLTNGAGVDAAIEAVGATLSVQQALAAVRTAGHITWIGNAQREVSLNMQDVVGREITIRGVYGFYREFGEAIEALASGEIDVKPLIDRIAPLSEGPELFREMAEGRLDAVKVILHP
jgi:L-iditol 2-dehydrogenase